MQNLINTQCPRVTIVPLIFYSNQTSLSNDGKVIEYPLMMSITNIGCKTWYLDEGHVLFAILPVISSTKSSHERRLQIFHECLDVNLKLLKESNFKGLSLIDPRGDEHWVFPLLYAYVCDHFEGCKMCCLSSCHKCKYIQILSLWKLELEKIGFSFSHLMTYDLYVVCGLVGYMYLWHKSMSTSIQFVHVSKTILKGGGKKVWLPS